MVVVSEHGVAMNLPFRFGAGISQAAHEFCTIAAVQDDRLAMIAEAYDVVHLQIRHGVCAA